MSLKTMTISIPASMRNFVEYKVDAAGYGSVSEYIRELIRLDQRRDLERLDEWESRQSERTEFQGRPPFA